jgi:hypothetical protein
MLEIAAFTGALSSLGALIKVANESKNVEMTGKLIELQQKIIAMQSDFGEMQQKLFEVQQESRKLTESLARKNQYEHRFNVLWRKGDDGKYIGPFCPICNGAGKEMPLRPAHGYDKSQAWYYMACHTFHQQAMQAPGTPIIYQILKSEIPENW